MWPFKKKEVEEIIEEKSKLLTPVDVQLCIIYKTKDSFSFGYVKAIYDNTFIVGDCSTGTEWNCPFEQKKDYPRVELVYKNGESVIVSEELECLHLDLHDVCNERLIKEARGD